MDPRSTAPRVSQKQDGVNHDTILYGQFSDSGDRHKRVKEIKSNEKGGTSLENYFADRAPFTATGVIHPVTRRLAKKCEQKV